MIPAVLYDCKFNVQLYATSESAQATAFWSDGQHDDDWYKQHPFYRLPVPSFFLPVEEFDWKVLVFSATRRGICSTLSKIREIMMQQSVGTTDLLELKHLCFELMKIAVSMGRGQRKIMRTCHAQDSLIRRFLIADALWSICSVGKPLTVDAGESALKDSCTILEVVVFLEEYGALVWNGAALALHWACNSRMRQGLDWKQREVNPSVLCRIFTLFEPETIREQQNQQQQARLQARLLLLQRFLHR
ncbi:hypothetical protein EAH_00022640 [Eimeria acervulina]|uniref:Uncharacterized protein n=1 Tax=Eimeria acervulina TaxID=5801 RepID=U6GAB1_EIMAC|nr:hypothetical protein EAH_00022640 [Eimeria acervulina]CDI77211.1 hypothetical protein EAH_00022640 [Eimeria acervulina]